MEAQLLAFLGAAILLTLSPGPDIVYVLVQSMTNGKKAGIMTALGLVSGIVVHTTLLAFGISLIIKESPTIFFIIKILGACYLFYLAFQVYKSGNEFMVSEEKLPQKKGFALYRRGFIMNVINPKVLIFFLAFFPGFLWDQEHQTVLQFYILGGIFMTQAFLIFLLVSLLAGRIANYLKHRPGIGFWFKWVQIVVFIGIGIFILIPN